MEIGKPKDGNKKKVFKIKNGDNVFRVLPPLGKLAESGKWRVYQEVQWGFKGSNGRLRPFIDPRKVNYQTKMVEVESQTYLLRQSLKKEKDALMTQLRANPTNESLKKQASDKVELIKRFNLDAKHYLNVVNLNGEIGLLKINTKLKNALEDQIKAYREKNNQHPLYMGEKGMSGLFFNFYRSNPTGKIQDYVFQVTPYKEVVNQQGDERNKVHTMDDGFISRLNEEAYDLSKMYPTPTADDVEKLVSALGTPNEGVVVDQVLGSYNTGSSDDDAGDDEEDASSPLASSSPSSATTLTSTVASTPTKTVAPSPTSMSTSVGSSAGVPSNVTSNDSTTTTSTATKESTPSTSMSDEEFLRSLGAM